VRRCAAYRGAGAVRLFAGTLLAGSLLASSGLAARTMREKLDIACRDDLQTLCPGLNDDEAKACMLRHRARVSAACMRLVDASE
jgi:hypothetical protein